MIGNQSKVRSEKENISTVAIRADREASNVASYTLGFAEPYEVPSGCYTV